MFYEICLVLLCFAEVRTEKECSFGCPLAFSRAVLALNWWDGDGIVSSCQTEGASNRADGEITRSFQASLSDVDVLKL